MKVGERIQSLQRLYLTKVGYGRDILPWRWTHEPMPEGPCAGQVVNLEPMLDEYYALRGWDKNGVPGQAKLKELGLA
jgi:aldehyde:ferredoxin oxidoreductase